MAINPHKQPTTTQQRLMWSLKNTRLLPDGGFCLSDKRNEILFSSSISPQLTTNPGLDGAGLCLGLLGHGTSNQCTSSSGGHINSLNYTSPVDSGTDSVRSEVLQTVKKEKNILHRIKKDEG
jgi:hypothetical protein